MFWKFALIIVITPSRVNSINTPPYDTSPNIGHVGEYNPGEEPRDPSTGLIDNFHKMTLQERMEQHSNDREILERSGSLLNVNYTKWEQLDEDSGIDGSSQDSPSGRWYSRMAHPQHALPIIEGRRVSWGTVPKVTPAFMGKVPDAIYKSDSMNTLWFNGYLLDKRQSNLTHIVWRHKTETVVWLRRGERKSSAPPPFNPVAVYRKDKLLGSEAIDDLMSGINCSALEKEENKYRKPHKKAIQNLSGKGAQLRKYLLKQVRPAFSRHGVVTGGWSSSSEYQSHTDHEESWLGGESPKQSVTYLPTREREIAEARDERRRRHKEAGIPWRR
ncbi:hypothetical protein AAMO2058_000483100 [Amorphochlora amoebiformis]